MAFVDLPCGRPAREQIPKRKGGRLILSANGRDAKYVLPCPFPQGGTLTEEQEED